MKKTISLFLVLSIIFALSSCKKESEALNIYYPVKTELYSLDPQICEGDAAKIAIANIFDGLLYLDEDANIHPAAAESYNISQDGLTYTFNLRQGTHWKISNLAKTALKDKLPKNFDTRVTAYDFVFALRRAVAPITRAEDAVLLSSIHNAEEILQGNLVPEHLGVKAISDYILEITLTERDDDFLYTLCLPLCMPCNEIFFEACGGRYGLSLNYTLSNGPFYFARWREDASLRIAKDDDYTGSRQTRLDSIYLYENKETDDIISNLNAGTYNIANLTYDQFTMLKKPQSYKKIEFENELWALCFNFANKNLANKSLRQAIAYSINPDIFKSFDKESFTTRTIPPFCKPEYKAEDIKNSPLIYDNQKAQKELESALKALSKSSVELVLSCLYDHEQILRQQIQEWQKSLGIDINIRLLPLDFEDLERAVLKGDYDMAFYPLKALSLEAENFYQTFTGASRNNILSLDDFKYDEKFKNLIRSKDKNEKILNLKEIEKYVIEELIYYPIFIKSNYLVMQNTLGGIYTYPSPETIYFHNFQYIAN